MDLTAKRSRIDEFHSFPSRPGSFVRDLSIDPKKYTYIRVRSNQINPLKIGIQYSTVV